MSDGLNSSQEPSDTTERHETRSQLERIVGSKERRRMRARRMESRSMWFGLGMFGVIGWSIAVPMMVGISIGLWIDSQVETQRSWTLMLMVAGLAIGCLNAWTWIRRESDEKHESDGEVALEERKQMP